MIFNAMMLAAASITTGDTLAAWCEQDDPRCEVYIAGHVEGVEQELFLREDKRDYCFPSSWTPSDGKRVFLARWRNNMRSYNGAWRGNKASVLLWTSFSTEYPCRS